MSIERLVKFMSHQYFECDRLTTLVDFYGFEKVAGKGPADIENDLLEALSEKVQALDRRFVLPYVQMHEFEGLLFTDIEKFEVVLDGWNEHVRDSLLKVRDAFDTPEDINNHRETAPSKRILAAFEQGSYRKTLHGPLIAEEIGLARIRKECPRFNTWLERIERWA